MPYQVVLESTEVESGLRRAPSQLLSDQLDSLLRCPMLSDYWIVRSTLRIALTVAT